MSQADDIDAIHDYISRTATVTNEAAQLRDSFIQWWTNLGWFEKNTNDSILQEAKTRRTAFNAANKTPEQVVVPLTQEEQEFFENMPTVDTSQMTPQEAHQAIWTPKPGAKKPPASLANLNIPTADGSSTTASSGGIRRTLQLTSPRMKGEDVREWQLLIGITPADSEYGTGSVKKTKEWQTSKGLTANGIVDAASWAAATTPSVVSPVTPPVQVATTKPVTKKEKKKVPAFAETVASIPVKPPVVAEAGVSSIFKGLKDMPLWAWITLGIATVGGVFFAKKPEELGSKISAPKSKATARKRR